LRIFHPDELRIAFMIRAAIPGHRLSRLDQL
jgi:hypothetical protein